MAEPLQETTITPDASTKDHAASPPPDSPGAVWTRRIIIFAFWAVVATLGLPHWIWTTSIYRSELPVEQMTQWAEGNACQLQYPIRISLESAAFPLEQVEQVAANVQNILDLDGDKSLYSFEILAQGGHRNTSSHPALTISLHREDGPWQVRFKQISLDSTLEIAYSDANSSVGDMARPIADEVRQVFKDEQAAIAYLLQGTSFGTASKDFQLKSEMSQSIEKRTTRAFRYASEYHVTFSLFAASASPSAWDIEEAVKQYIEPLLRQLAPISKFHIDTQVQLFASFSPSIAGPQLDEESNTYKLLQSDLSGFINAAEWPLSPSIGTGPTINMVLYVPGPNQSPLLLETGGNSWTIPQWGGVQILNPSITQADRLATADLKPVMLTFADQLMALLGVPNSPPSLPMRISSLKRERATSLILSASSTLGALVRLTRKLESIAIPATVATSVDETISHLAQACSNLREGRYQTALENARVAEEEAEKAFFEPSMVGQVYFPDEHKVAVYVPLLGPMAVPLIMSALKELKSWRQAKKVKTS